jgi:hypothetical protein
MGEVFKGGIPEEDDLFDNFTNILESCKFSGAKWIAGQARNDKPRHAGLDPASMDAYYRSR